MKIISWNINSLRKRLNHLELLVQNEAPDIICLQETKVHNDHFPSEQIKKLGFDYQYYYGGKSYHGVAILSKFPLENVQKIAFDELDYGRHIQCHIHNKIVLHNFYVPAGGSGNDENNLDTDKFLYKINYLKNMIKFFKEQQSKNQYAIITGDLNIAPEEHDVWSHKQLLKVISHTPIETDLFRELMEIVNLIDAGRITHSREEKLYSWWSYRSRDWKNSNRGRRLDHFLITKNLHSDLQEFKILKNMRDLVSPSDHAPLMITIKTN